MNRNPVIIALDVESAAQARTLVTQLGESADFYKIGLELYTAVGTDLVREILDRGKQVFLDLKFYDIRETVRRAVAQAAKLRVRFLTVHAVHSVMEAAVEGKEDSQLQLLGVTVLTDLDQGDLRKMGHSCTVDELVAQRAMSAAEIGIDGLVCSPMEVARVRRIAGSKMVLVTPGVRSAGATAGDQKRIATPGQAIANGADYLVVGRQVTRAEDPKRQLERILEEICAISREGGTSVPP